MAKLSEFIAYLNEQAGKSIYVWGAQGQLLSKLTEADIRHMETSASNAKKAIEMWNKRKSISGARAFDCSGLGCYWLYNLKKVIPSDKTAAGLYSMCAKITKASVTKGDWVFKSNLLGKITHIGYVVDNDKNVVEAQGRAYGVVKRPLGAGGWNKYGRPNINWEKEDNVFVLKRVLKKGSEGDDVKWVQRRLINLGYDLGKRKDDGDFGTKTDSAVRSFQRTSGLKDDGKVGENTIKVLGGRWMK